MMAFSILALFMCPCLKVRAVPALPEATDTQWAAVQFIIRIQASADSRVQPDKLPRKMPSAFTWRDFTFTAAIYHK